MTKPSLKKKRYKLLEATAQTLTYMGAVHHPCAVALVHFDPKINLNRYVTLFTDWCEASDHDSLNKWEHLYGSKLKKPLTEWTRTAGNPSGFPEDLQQLSEIMKKGSLPKEYRIKLVADVLKQVCFYAPFTQIIYEQAKQIERQWGFTDFVWDEKFYHQISETRAELEQNHGHQGHWELGLLLEAFILSSHYLDFYGGYFVREGDTDNTLLIAAACETEEQAKRVAGLKYLLDYAPTYFTDALTVTSARKRSRSARAKYSTFEDLFVKGLKRTIPLYDTKEIEWYHALERTYDDFSTADKDKYVEFLEKNTGVKISELKHKDDQTVYSALQAAIKQEGGTHGET